MKRSGALERAKGLIVRTELGFHVDPHGVGPLGREVRLLVDDVVENLVAEVAHPDLVEVGEREADAAAHRVPGFAGLTLFAAQVLGRLVHAIDERRVRVIPHGERRRHGA